MTWPSKNPRDYEVEQPAWVRRLAWRADERPRPPYNHALIAYLIGAAVAYPVSLAIGAHWLALISLLGVSAMSAYIAWWRRRERDRATPNPKAHTPNL